MTISLLHKLHESFFHAQFEMQLLTTIVVPVMVVGFSVSLSNVSSAQKKRCAL